MTDSSTRGDPGPRQFATTRWSLVVAAGDTGSTEGRDALASLCAMYWSPVHSFIRRSGRGAEEAADLTQAFFTYLLEKRSVRSADRTRGRFRNFLLASVKNFLANEWDRGQAIKRGAGVLPVSFSADEAEERFQVDQSSGDSPERAFERRWAHTMVERVLERLGEEMEESGQGDRFARLRSCLSGDEDRTYRQIGDEIGLSESAVKVAVHRMRRRFGDILREEVAATVRGPEDVEGEIRYLFEVLGPA